MALREDLQGEISQIFQRAWTIEQTETVPEPENLRLANHGKSLEGAVLYADLEDSTAMVSRFKKEFSAEIYKAFLLGSCRIIRQQGGVITSFDGDRVMGVFVGDYKCTSAAKAGLKIHDLVRNIINPAVKSAYPTTDFVVKHTTGVDVSEVLAARTGIRNNNDVVWVSKAANLAAKFCSIRGTQHKTIISEAVYSKLNAEAKLGGAEKKNMWVPFTWAAHSMRLYGSSWTWAV